MVEFGLDPPAYVVSLGAAGRTDVVDFGALDPAETSQYVRIIGRPYLLPRHVGEEWQVAADMAKQLSPPDGDAESQESDDGFGRDALLAPDGELVKIAGYEVEQPIGLLRAIGAAS
jgi:hypothetical protein